MGGAMKPLHWVVLIVVVLLLFGAGKLPSLARNLGKSMRIFKSEVDELKKENGNGEEAEVEAPAAPAAREYDPRPAPAPAPAPEPVRPATPVAHSGEVPSKSQGTVNALNRDDPYRRD